MKKYDLVCLMMLAAVSAPMSWLVAQEIQDYQKVITGTKAYKRLEWFNKQRQNPDGTIPVDIYWAERERAIEEQHRLAKTSPAGHVQWESIGPHGVNALPNHWGTTSGRVRGLAIHPSNPDIAYIGVAAGGIWKTTNGGTSWTPLGDDLESLTFGAIAIDPQNPQTVYAGTGEARFRFGTGIYDGKGLFKSTDGGATWSEITTAFGAQTHFAALHVDPSDSDIIYAALASGYSFLGNLNNEGIWVSSDAGLTWTQTFAFNDAFDALPHPTRVGDVYAAIGGGDDDSSGVWFSDDFGNTWTQRSNGLPNSNRIDRIHLAISPNRPALVYAVIFERIGQTYVYKSTNSGVNWQQIAIGLGGDFGSGRVDQGGYDLCIAVNPNDADEVYVGNVELHRTTDGQNFQVVRNFGILNGWDSPMHVDYHVIRYAPSDPTRIYVGNDGGIYRSTDGGSDWNSLGSGINTIQFYRIASSPHNANTLIGGAQDNGIIGQTVVPGGIPQRWDNLSTGDGFECFFDPTNPDIVYASTQNVNLYKSTNGLDGFNFIGIPIAGRITNGIPDNERNLIFLAPFFMHPTDPNTLYTATTRPFRSTNGGDLWLPLSAPLVGPNATIQAMAISRGNPQVLICATGAQVFISSDGGFNWTDRTGVNVFPNRLFTRVVTHPHQDSTLFVVVGGFNAGQTIFRTTDLGVNWTNISGNLPNVPHSDLFVDPQFPNNQVMYVANDLGVYATTDGGGSWQRESTGMPVVPAVDFDYHFGERLLRVATHGRSVFQAHLPLAALALTSPNGGEHLAVGAVYDIHWIGSGFSNPATVRLEYSLDNGGTWQLLRDNVANNGSFAWRVPTTISPSDSALIRVINPDNENIMDGSNAVFTIFIDPHFAVLANSPFVNDRGTFTSASWVDYDNDEDLDIALTSEHPTERPLRLYRNNGNSFSNVTAEPIGTYPFQSFGNSWGDFDKDGDLDLAVAGVRIALMRNNGNGTFDDATSAVFFTVPDAEITSLSWVDFDRDNNLDLFATTGGSDFASNSRNILFRQNTPGQLTDTFFQGNFDSRNAVWGDYNNDGFPDVFVSNHGGQANRLYTTVKNGANFEFSELALDPGSNSNAAAWGDYDNDGDLDLFVANDGPNFLYRNNGDATFTLLQNIAPAQDAGNSKTCTWGDFDSDGHLDLFVGNDGPNFLYRNTGNGSFEQVELSAVTTTNDFTNSAAWGDDNNDGALDLLVANGVVGTSATETNILYRNRGNGNHWLQVKLHGVISNLSGIGARVTIYPQAAGSGGAASKEQAHSADHSGMQMREISGLTGTGQNSTIAHFGLGAVAALDSIVVEWSSRRRSVVRNVTADQRLTIFEVDDNRFLKTAAGDLVGAADFAAGAWGDVNNDGYDDLLLVSYSGDIRLYTNGTDGSFRETLLGRSGAGRFTGATWADSDNDGDLDLFITNDGGTNILYVNTGRPEFTLKKVTRGALVEDKENSQAASWGDFNKDGLVDLFVANAGKGQLNTLYINQGKNRFARVTTGPVTRDSGTATSCTWVDINDDGVLDLFVTYDGQADLLYLNSGSPSFIFSKLIAGQIVQDKSSSFGSSWSDYDHDGDLDVYVLKNGQNVLFRNDGNGLFAKVTNGGGLDDVADSRSSAWGEVTNNGFPDLFVANNGLNQLYTTTAEQSIVRTTVNAATLTTGHHVGVSWADIDRDGDHDLFVANTRGVGSLYLNKGGNNNWLEVTCIGTISNSSAIGTRIRVKADLDAKLPGIWQTLEISAQTGTGSQNSLTQLFGLREATLIDSLVVEWPRSSPLVLTDVPVNQHLILRESVQTRFTLDDKSEPASFTLSAGGASWADIEGDGDEDLFVTTLQGRNLLFTNTAGKLQINTGSELSRQAMTTVASTWADVDNDGSLDVFVANDGENSVLFINKGDGTFGRADGSGLDAVKVAASSASWGDFDNDGLVDLFIGTRNQDNLLYRNLGSGKFTRVTDGELVNIPMDTRACAWSDFDNDGRLDLFVANFNERNVLYHNDGGGKFTSIEQPPFTADKGASVGCSWGDFDNDGWQDLFVANTGEAKFLYRNNGDGTFGSVAGSPIGAGAEPSSGSSWVDFDSDADLDLYVSAFDGTGSMFRNLGSGYFEQVQNSELTANKAMARGHAWADVDDDGDMDVFIATDGEPQRFFRNAGTGNDWIRLHLKGTRSNAAGIGARVRLKAFVNGFPQWQTREVSAQTGGGMSGQSSLPLTFGLGRAAKVDSVVIHWPSGGVQVLTGLIANRAYTVEEDFTTSVERTREVPADYALYHNYPNPFNPSTTIEFAVPEVSQVTIKIYDILGREIVTLVDARYQPGRYKVVFEAGQLASGLYLYRIQANAFRKTRKFLLLK